MGFQFFVMVIGILFFFAGSPSSMADQANGTKSSNPSLQMSLAPQYDPNASTPRDFLVKSLHLNMYESMADNSPCDDNSGDCLTFINRMQSWMCASEACDGKNNKEPIACFKEVANSPVSVKEQINAVICPLIKSPSAQTRQAFLKFATEMEEDELVEMEAFIMALKGSASSCEDLIKQYVGPYGPAWTSRWYQRMSGCRILSKERSVQEENDDIFAWVGNECTKIVNPEMQKACKTVTPPSALPSKK